MTKEIEELKKIRKVTEEEISEAIKGVNNVDAKGKHPGMVQMLNWLSGDFVNYIGYTVITSKRKIICILNNDSSCCEEWDVEYNKEKTRAKNFKIVLNVDDVDGDYYEGSAVELIVTENNTKHTIKLWNSHNGYYAHDYFIFDTSGEFVKGGLI